MELTLEIRIEGYASPVARSLVADAMADLTVRYGGRGDGTPVAAHEFDPPNGAFLVAYLDGEPVGCAAWRTNAEDPSAAEIKRMYVRPAARGRGVAMALLRAVENDARSAGRTHAVLETGTKQPEAIALYEKAGYARIPDFGHYRDAPNVRSFGRHL